MADTEVAEAVDLDVCKVDNGAAAAPVALPVASEPAASVPAAEEKQSGRRSSLEALNQTLVDIGKDMSSVVNKIEKSVSGSVSGSDDSPTAAGRSSPTPDGPPSASPGTRKGSLMETAKNLLQGSLGGTQSPELEPMEHDFAVTTFRKSKICKKCGKLLAGLCNQGVQCLRCKSGFHAECSVDLGKTCPGDQRSRRYFGGKGAVAPDELASESSVVGQERRISGFGESFIEDGHYFVLDTFVTPKSCAVCKSLMLGINYRAHICTECKVMCHPKCSTLLQTDCHPGGMDGVRAPAKAIAVGSLHVRIVEGKNLKGSGVLTEKDHADVFCVVSLQDGMDVRHKLQIHRTATVKGTIDPVFHDEFDFTVVIPKESTVHVVAIDEAYWHNEDTKDYDHCSGDAFMGQTSHEVGDLVDEQMQDSWVELHKRSAFMKARGQLRVQLQYSPLGNVDDDSLARYDVLLKQLCCDPSMAFVQAICEHLDQREHGTHMKDTLSVHLLRIFESQNQALNLLRYVIDREIQSTTQEGTLFRTDSIATKMMTAFTKMYGADFLKTVVAPVLKRTVQAVESGVSFEVDPNRRSKAGLMHEDEPVQKSLAMLRAFCQELVESICTSVDAIHPYLRELAQYLSEAVHEKYPDAKQIVLSGFFFLRYVCPAIFSADQYQLLDKPFSTDVRRAFTLAVKVLNNLANGKAFGDKEAYMIPLNDFFPQHIDTVQDFFCDLVEMPEETRPQRLPETRETRLVVKELMTLIRTVKPKVDSIQEYLNAQHKPKDAYDAFRLQDWITGLEFAASSQMSARWQRLSKSSHQLGKDKRDQRSTSAASEGSQSRDSKDGRPRSSSPLFSSIVRSMMGGKKESADRGRSSSI